MTSLGLYFQEQLVQSLNMVMREELPHRYVMAGVNGALDVDNPSSEQPGANEGILSFKTDLAPYKKEFYYTVFTNAGIAEWYKHAGDYIPQVSMGADRVMGRQEDIAIGFEWSERDLQLAQAENTGLIEEATRAMKQGTDVKLEDSYWLGAPELKIWGLTNFPNTSTTPLPADGVGANPTTIASKTPPQMYRDLNFMAKFLAEQSRNVFASDELMLPLEVFNIVNETVFDSASDSAETVLGVFLRNQLRNPSGIRQVRPIPYLSGLGTNGSGLAIAYNRNPSNMQAILSEYFNVKANNGGNEVNFKYSTKSVSTTGGTTVFKPLSIAIFDGL